MQHHTHTTSTTNAINTATSCSIGSLSGTIVNSMTTGYPYSFTGTSDVSQTIIVGDIKIDGKNKVIQMKIDDEWVTVLTEQNQLDKIRHELAEFWPGALVDLVMKGIL